MKKKSLLGLILFACLVIAGMFLATELLIGQESKAQTGRDRTYISKENNTQDKTADVKASDNVPTTQAAVPSPLPKSNEIAGDSLTAVSNTSAKPQLIYDSSKVDYKAYIPRMQMDGELKSALNITNPDISIDAKAAILFDIETKKVLYYKNAVKAVFPASTLKLLTSLTALAWCSEDEKVTIGDEITMIAPDSTKADLKEGQVLRFRNLLEAMLLPSGNDAAYAVAAYVGRKSLKEPEASKEAAVAEFIRLMNKQAAELGVKNSCFKTPDGYDAIGQYTTAYDMGLIGMAAAKNSAITEIVKKSSSRNTFISGEDVTWDNTNKLINRYSGEYYSAAIGLKTGTSSMAGKCLISAAKEKGREVLCVIMKSTSEGRWEDSIQLMKYGLSE